MADREGRALTPARRELFLSAAFAVWGLAIAISLTSVWQQPAPPGQLPGLATHLNFDAHGPFRWILGMIVLPIVVPLILRPVSRRLAEGLPWARNAALIAPLVALWFVLITRSPGWVILPFGAVIALCTLLRNRPLAFTKHDVVLVPVLLMTVLALHDAIRSISIDRLFVVAALIVFLIRVAIALIGGRAPRPPAPRDSRGADDDAIPAGRAARRQAGGAPAPLALAFVAAPLGLLLQTGFFARDQRYFGWHALAFVVITPFIMRLNARRALALLVFVTYPLALVAYINATSLETAEGKPRVDVFEDSHPLLPASEYLAGELPYRDVIPTHGLIEDGLFDYLVMKARGASIGAAWKARLIVGMLNAVAMYALAWALTGSPHAAFLAVLLSALTNMFTPAIRLLPSLITLALICGAVRWRRLQWLRYAAIGTVACGAMSIDFGAYTFLVFLVAVFRFPGDRLKTLRAAATGLAIGVVPLFGGLMVLGILDDFFRTTFVELLSLGPVYAVGMFAAPTTIAHAFPEALAGVLHRDGFVYVVWCVAAILAAVFITRRPRRRLEPLVLVALWMTVVAISYAERHHFYYTIAAAPFAVGLAMLVIRRRNTPVTVAMILGFLILAAPTTHLGVTDWIREARGPVEPAWVELPHLPRARGALFKQADADAIRGVQKYVSLALAPDETWLDFTNRGIFYFLLRRDCPIRQPEVAFYETEARQRDVIHRLESDPRIRAVLLPGPRGHYTVDGIPNAQRAPLVWQYIQDHFTPDFAEGEVVMWRRK